ncbi:hydrolase [Mycolicibacterium duvalii]|uniref:Hydrolase n=1 Tax=Mycolicibacterium duvalii TaxID=39688 RepID=A0A7I7JZN5_9MYCO|nr:CocE/NonD family hydrolase [Mycolicibacterium duvalii]MCV7367280.1 CocE/NonD family hydrolase [Mycolicibacterium duvalii]PEG43558.1 hydrolase [Mycolicibacterium duvalii]BBX17350.1 hydrolase [Mycolicibacterium duvalii]
MSSRISRLARHTLSRVLDLPPPACDFHVEKSLRVPMRDGVELIADHYAPQTAKPAGTLLVRGPYGRGYPFSALFGSVYAARGYHVVIQSVRGTFGSDGQFDPFVNEVADGADTAAWLRDQAWFTGTFATMGLSYLGFTQWALLTDPPPELRAAVITVGPDDVSGPRWGTGSFGLNDFLGWSDLVGRQEDPNRLRTLVRQAGAQRRVTKASLELPLGAASRALLGDGAPWFESWLEHPDTDDPFWAKLYLRDLLDRAEVPVLLLSGWQDLFVEQTLEHYRMLTGRGVPTGLTVGPWTHGDMMTKAAPTVLRESLDWLATHLADAAPQRRAAVRVHLAGHGWLEMAEWPPVMPTQVLHPQPGGRLAPAAPAAGETATFVYNPADPTPTVGGRLLSPAGGYRDDTELARRADVLTFTGAPLAADLFVVGAPALEVEHSCANPHNDLFVRISQVDRHGESRNISDGYLASAPDSGTVRIELDPVAWTFPKGSRIRVLIAGGSHPRFLRNLGTGEPVAEATTYRTARHTVHLGAATRLVLPAGPRPPSAD